MFILFLKKKLEHRSFSYLHTKTTEFDTLNPPWYQKKMFASGRGREEGTVSVRTFGVTKDSHSEFKTSF